MDEPVDHRGGDGVVAEDLAPGAERLVGGDDQAGALVAAADEHEHQVGGLGVERDVADLVDRSAAGSARAGEFVVEAALALARLRAARPTRSRCGRGRAGRPGRRGSRARSPGVSCRCRVGPTPRCWSAVQEVELAEVLDHCLLDRALEGEVELLQRLAGGEARGADAGLAAVRLARRTARSPAAPRRSAHSSTPPTRARSASFGSALAAAGAFSARNRCASSDARAHAISRS